MVSIYTSETTFARKSGTPHPDTLTTGTQFITYLYKEHIRKTQECNISLRFHYSLVFDFSPTLRQIASTALFLVTRNAKQISVYLVQNDSKFIQVLQIYDLRHYSIFGKHTSIIITLLIGHFSKVVIIGINFSYYL